MGEAKDGTYAGQEPAGEELRPLPQSHPLAEVRPEAWAKVLELLRHVRSEGTRLAYASDLWYFWTWAEATYTKETVTYPAKAGWVVEFVLEHTPLGDLGADVRQALEARGSRRPGGKTVTTLRRRVAALSVAHDLLGFSGDTNPCRSSLVREALKAARRLADAAGQRPRQAKALLQEDLERLVATCQGEGADLIDLRDRALLLLGWASGGRRRSEIVAVNVEDLEKVGGEWVLHLRRSKTDQAGEGLIVPLKGKGGRAVQEWLKAAGIREGAIFRPVIRCGRGRRNVRVRDARLDGEVVAEIVRRRARQAGLEDWELCNGHSLRAGFATAADLAGHTLSQTMGMTGHRSSASLVKYQRLPDALRNPAADMVVDDGA